MGKSTCELCGKEFNFNSVPHMHVKACEKKHGVEPKPPASAVLIDPYKPKGGSKFDKEALANCKEVIKLNLAEYFNVNTMSGNERAQVNRMLQESDEVIEKSLIELLKLHGIKAY